MDFKKFYSYEEMTEALEQLEREYPDLASVTSIGTSREGRHIWCMQLAARTDQRCLSDRTAHYVQGNLHAAEFAGSLQALYIAEHLLKKYDHDPTITRLLDERCFYIVPRVDVDGAERVLSTADPTVRSRVDPTVERNVPSPEDIDGDGLILTMRWQDADGPYRLSDGDKRLLIPREPGDTGPFYATAPEGPIPNWDGRTVSKSTLRNDFNRNFPAGWQPHHGWLGNGPYPLSETETRAVADFILAHPNIIGATDFHTGNPVIFYPSAVIEETAKHPQDVRLFREIGSIGEELTSFPLVSGYSELTEGTKTERLPGSFKDWAYEHLGMIDYIVELGLFYNSLGLAIWQPFESRRAREEAIGTALLEWHDDHPDSGLFVDWKAAEHPQLGTVEIGGFFWPLWANPPLDRLEEICRRCTEFVVRQAEFAPQIDVQLEEKRQLGDGWIKLTIAVRNTGSLSTSITEQGKSTHPRAEPLITLSMGPRAQFAAGRPSVVIDHLSGYSSVRRYEWVVRPDSPRGVIEVRSPRGIYAREEFRID